MNRPAMAAPGADTGRYSAKDYFTYSIKVPPVAASAQQPGSFTVDAGWDFMWSKATFLAIDDSGAIIDEPNLTILINDTGTGRNMSNIPVPILGVFGTGTLPFILPTQKLFQARATVAVTVINNDAAVNFDAIYLQFIGTQLFLK